MKTTSFIFLIASALIVSSFTIFGISEEPLVLEKNIQVDGYNKEVIFQNARQWLLKSIKPAERILYMDEISGNLIILSGNILMESISGGCGIVNVSVDYKLSIRVQDDSYQYRFDHFTLNYVRSCGEYGEVPVRIPLEKIDLKEKIKLKIEDDLNTKLKSIIDDMIRSIENS